MAVVSLCLYALWLLVIVVRIGVMWRTTGTTGVRRPSQPLWSAEGVAGASMTSAFGAAFAGPVADLADVLPLVPLLDRAPVAAAGVVLAVTGIVVTTAAQFGMGSSWRIGVDPGERTDLVTGGLFAVVRHPIYSAITVALIGLALIVPNVASLAGVALIVVGAEIQTRKVEEPYMLSKHGSDYAEYRARIGRFVPSVGRVRT